jgi:hypothetical protein
MSPLKTQKGMFYAFTPFKPYAAILRDKRRGTSPSSIAEWLALLQGIFYVGIALWPLAALRSFMALTGTQTDVEVIRGLAVLIGLIGMVLIVAAVRSVLTLELGLLLAGSGLAMGLLDMTFAVNGASKWFFLAKGIEEFTVSVLCLLFLSQFTHRRHSSFI